MLSISLPIRSFFFVFFFALKQFTDFGYSLRKSARHYKINSRNHFRSVCRSIGVCASFFITIEMSCCCCCCCWMGTQQLLHSTITTTTTIDRSKNFLFFRCSSCFVIQYRIKYRNCECKMKIKICCFFSSHTCARNIWKPKKNRTDGCDDGNEQRNS